MPAPVLPQPPAHDASPAAQPASPRGARVWLSRRLRHLAVGLALLPLLGGCSQIAYYWQAGLGQWEILHKREPISEVLADPAVSAETKRKLRLVLSVQDFATKALALPTKGHYTTYADLGRPYVSWLVVATPALSLAEHRFCYPIVGCLGYRGYFAKADAQAEAAELHADGLDTLVRPVRAYSTLGWFNDPVLNTFLAGDDTELIGTIIHEQTHRLYFLKGATDFNESFAVFVEGEGVRRYLSQPGENPALITRYEAIRADQQRFLDIVRRGRARLAELYGSDLPDADKRTRKPALFEAMRQDYQKERSSFTLLNYDDWFAQPLNNAYLAGVEQYARHVAAFRALFIESGRDFPRFYAAVEALGALPADEREARLNRLEHKVVARSEHP
ncbi:MAG TPA: aminopeptidase [bacterium]|nr:aminopeptidase [bacterium]